MPDQNFFKRAQALTLSKIAEIGQARLAEGCDPDYVIEDVAPLSTAAARDLSFLDNVKYKAEFSSTKAGACFVSEKARGLAPAGVHLLLSEHPYRSYALVAQAFYPQPAAEGKISPAAHVAASAQIGAGVDIEAGAVISEHAVIGDHSRIGANTVIGEHVKIGAYARVGSNCTITHALIGEYVSIYPGVRIGQDGFGFAIDPRGYVKVPQLGRVIIEDHVEIGANTTIDRGAGPDTVIGQGTWIDNLVQIGHNVKIGRGCIIVAQAGISGSTVVEDFVALGGQSGIAGHLRIGRGAKVGAQAGIMRDVPPGTTYGGSPAVPMRQHMRHMATLNRLINKNK